MIRVLENLVHTNGNRDIKIAGEEPNTFAYIHTGDISHLEVGKTYTYSITFQGKKGGYGNMSAGSSATSGMMVEHTGDVQTVHYTVVLSNNTKGFYLVTRRDNNYTPWESIRLISISVHEGEHGSDIYMPPHSLLTPEQIALMKYGEFTEAQQI